MALADLKIRYKIALVLNVLSIGIILIISILSYQQFSNVLQERILLQLSSIRNLKSIQMENLLDAQIEEITTMMEYIGDTDYLDALAKDDLIQIDSILIADEAYQIDSVFLEDISADFKDASIHLVCHYPTDSAVFLFYFTPQKIKDVLFEHTGMGQTGETYIVGENRTMRTQSRFFPEDPPSTIAASTLSVEDGMDGNEGMRLQNDYRSIPVFSSYAPFTKFGLNWVILSEIDRDEAFAPLESLKRNLALMAIVIIVAMLFVSYALASRLVRPILKMQETIRRLSDGEMQVESEEARNKDEIGTIQIALRRLTKSITDTVFFANEISRGNFDAKFTLRGKNDTLGMALMNMKNQLSAFQENELDLLKSNQRSLIKGEESERRRLARELHDSLGPVLTNLKMEVEGIKNGPKKDQMKEKIDMAISEVRVITMNLMPSVLKEFGLGEATANLIKYHESVSELQITYVNSVKVDSKIPEEIALTVYRIIQEAIHNAEKHAQAEVLKVSVTEFDDYVSLFVQDDGIGFDINQPRTGNGLGNMRERVNIFDGMYSLTSGDEGTQIEVEISFKPS